MNNQRPTTASMDSLQFWRLERARIVAHLQASGYVLSPRVLGWTEVLASFADERWLGRGPTYDDAIEDLLAQLAPSAVARAALVAAASATQDAADLPSPSSPSSPTQPDERPVEEPIAERAAVAPDAEPIAPVEARALSSEPPVAASVAPSLEAQAAGARATEDGDERSEAQGDALEQLESIQREIDEREEDLALMAPELQRLRLLAWAARVRATQESAGYEAASKRADAVFRTVNELSRRYWPGNVSALRRDAIPQDAARMLRGIYASSWDQVASESEALLERLAIDSNHERDEDGWADAKFLSPAPKDPEALLGQVVEKLRELESSEPGRAGEALALVARRLRWLRGAEVDPVQWGGAVGTLRRIAGDSLAQRAMDSSYAPARPWAIELGQSEPNPAKAARKRAVRALWERVPPVASVTVEGLSSWVREAIELEVPTEKIVESLRPYAASGVSIDARHFGDDRRLRRRANAILATLAGGAVLESPEDEGEDERPLDPPSAASGESLGTQEDARPEIRRAREWTRGRKALFVSNREDPLLREKLSKSLEFESLDWCVCDPRRIQSVRERIDGESVQLVLVATGFLSHKVDVTLADASRSRGVPYVRVDHGRLLACARAICRDLGLTRRQSTR